MQTLLQFVFYGVAVGGSAFFLINRRRFDFFTLGFASGLIYFLPGFFGFVRSSRNFALPEPLHPETYMVFIAVLATIALSAVIYDSVAAGATKTSGRSVSTALTTESALIIALLGLAATLVTSGGDLFSGQKPEVMEAIGRWHILFRFAALYLLVFAVHRKQVPLAVIGTMFLLFDLYVGFRIGIVIGLLAAATLLLNAKGAQSLLRRERRTIIFGVLLVAFVFVYKRIYAVVKLGMWDVVVDRLTDPQILLIALMNSEPFGTQSILNEVILTGFYTGPDHLRSVASLIVPFSNMLGAEVQNFNSLFQEHLFGGVVDFGLANNIWAQMYAIGGWAALAIAIPVYAVLLGLGSWLLSTTRGSLVALVVVAFTFIAFYAHRNDILYLLVLLRRCLMVWLVCILPGMLCIDAARVKRPRRLTTVPS